MKFRTLPGTDLQLSAIGLGCWAIGGRWWGDDVTDEDSARAIERALELGINWFDTAPLYGYGRADEVLVRTLGERRHEVVIATKVGVRWDGEGQHARSDLRPEYVVEDCEASLRRLGLETIPLLQVHWPCELNTPLEDTLGALDRLREQGKVRHIGLCNYGPEDLSRALELTSLACLQTPVSMVRREFESGLRDVCAPEPNSPRLGVLAYETLARGLLSGKFATPPQFPATDLRHRDDRFRGQSFARIDRLVQALRVVAERVGTTPAALAIAWVCSQPGVSVAIVGAKRAEQVEQNVGAVQLLGRAQLWRALEPHVQACRP